jgi:hypothetical protein
LKKGKAMNTMQEEFNAVCEHLMKQGRRAVRRDKDGNILGCAYRSTEGACAVGCRIPDELYDPRMEGWGLGAMMSVCKEDNIKLPPELDEYWHMFSALQAVHDTEHVTEWPKCLKDVAERHQLELPACVKEKLL